MSIESTLGHQPDPIAWVLLVQTGWVRDFEMGRSDADALYAEHQRLAQLQPEHWTREVPASDRLEALNRTLSQRAGDLPAVRHFRQRWLQDGFIAPEEIGLWIGRHNRVAGGVDSISSHEEDSGESQADEVTILGGSEEEIHYFVPGPPDAWEIELVAEGSPVAELKLLGDLLFQWTLWTPAESVTYVLTNRTPTVRLARGEALAHDGPVGRWRRIRLDVDPDSSPLDVLELFRQLREDLGKSRRGRARRPERLVLTFVEGRRGQKWSEILDAWNNRYPDLMYSQVTSLQRDYARARRLAGEARDNG